MRRENSPYHVNSSLLSHKVGTDVSPLILKSQFDKFSVKLLQDLQLRFLNGMHLKIEYTSVYRPNIDFARFVVWRPEILNVYLDFKQGPRNSGGICGTGGGATVTFILM